MNDSKCSFVATLIKDDFACEKAKLVTRRTGPDISCTSKHASECCKKLYEGFKAVGLPALDAEDDLLKTPHSVFAKIQFGGLLALAKDLTGKLDNTSTDNAPWRVVNIFQLVENALQYYQTLDSLPYAEYVDEIVGHQLKRKRKNKHRKL